MGGASESTVEVAAPGRRYLNSTESAAISTVPSLCCLIVRFE